MYPNAEPYRLLLQMILNVFNVMSIIYVYKCMQLYIVYIDIHILYIQIDR